MAPTKITFNDHNATPPVYVSGSFTDWQPVELPVTGEPGQYVYEKTFEVAPGTYQFKFRLGPGDWWVCDEQTEKTRDESGNENNVLVVEPEQVKAVPESVKPVPEPVPEPTKVASTPAPAPVTATESTVVPSVTTPKVEAAAPASQQFHNLVTKASPAPAAAKPVEAVETIKPAPKEVEQIPEATKATETQVQKPVNGTAIPPAATNDAESKKSSVSSLTPKEKKTVDTEPEKEKLGWFARVFLCGSSGKILLAAAVIGVPVLLAYVIQK